MTKYYREIFAGAGDTEAVPDEYQGDGKVSYERGYTPEQELPYTDPSAQNISRESDNQILKDLTANMQQYQQFGVFPYITDAMNGGVPYAYDKNAYCLYNGNVYRSNIDNNTALPTVASQWSRLNDYGDFYLDSGTANNYVLTATGGRGAPDAYFAGMTVKFFAANESTGGSTVNVAGLGVKDIRTDGVQGVSLSGGEINGYTELVYQGSYFVITNRAKSILSQSTVFTIGAGADYPNINTALREISTKYEFVDDGFAVLELQSGFVMSEQVVAYGDDYSKFSITSVDPLVSILTSSITETVGTVEPVFAAVYGGRLPIISSLFEFDASTPASSDVTGVLVDGAGSHLIVYGGCGVKKAPRHGLLVYRAATASIDGSDFSYSGVNGLWVSGGASVSAYSANFSNAGYRGVSAFGASSVNAVDCDISFATAEAIFAECSNVEARGANLSNAGLHCVSADDKAQVNIANANCDNSGSGQVRCNQLSQVNATSLSTAGATGVGLTVLGGSIISAQGTSLTPSKTANTVTVEGIIFQ